MSERERERVLGPAVLPASVCLKGTLLFQMYLSLNVDAANHIISHHLLFSFHILHYNLEELRIKIRRWTDGWMERIILLH